MVEQVLGGQSFRDVMLTQWIQRSSESGVQCVPATCADEALVSHLRGRLAVGTTGRVCRQHQMASRVQDTTGPGFSSG